MANEKWKIITVVALAVGIPLIVLLWWETYKVVVVYHGLTYFIADVVFCVLISVGPSIAVFLGKRWKRGKLK